MKQQYRFTFYKSNKKFICPECKQKSFVKYIDNNTDKLLPSEYGKCDHTNKCGYWLDPHKNGFAKNIWQEEREQQKNIDWKPKPVKPIKLKPNRKDVPIPIEVLKQTLSGYENNTFINNLVTGTPHPFPVEKVNEIISLYALGTISQGFRKGAITFPYIDISGNISAIQVKEFDKNNHTTGQGFYHSMLEYKYNKAGNELPGWLIEYNKNEKRVSCFFGSHLLKQYPANTIALVEAPKTAIYGNLYFGLPDTPGKYLWLAVYNKSSLTADRFKVLQGRNIVLFPDNNAFDEWSKKATEFQKLFPGTRIKISDLIESNADNKGSDLADYLVKINPVEFMDPEQRLTQLIKKQFNERMDPEQWIINPLKFQKLTSFNLEVLAQDINQTHNLKITSEEYLQSFYKYIKLLS